MDTAPAADQLVEELASLPARRGNLPGMGRPPGSLGKRDYIQYSHKDMVDFIIANPVADRREIGVRYGYTKEWVGQVMASDAFQCCLAARRAELVDPVLTASIEERFKGVTALSLIRLEEKLSAPQVSDNLVLRAVELGAKALGMGGNAPPAPPPQDHLAALANRLIELQANVRKGHTYENETVIPSEK